MRPPTLQQEAEWRTQPRPELEDTEDRSAQARLLLPGGPWQPHLSPHRRRATPTSAQNCSLPHEDSVLTKSPCPAGFPGKGTALERLSGPLPTLPTSAGPRPRLTPRLASPQPGSGQHHGQQLRRWGAKPRAQGLQRGKGSVPPCLRASVPPSLRASVRPPICCGASALTLTASLTPVCPCLRLSLAFLHVSVSLVLLCVCLSDSSQVPLSPAPSPGLSVLLCLSSGLCVSVFSS